MTAKIRTGIFASLGMLALILDSKTALEGGAAGLQVCLVQVIPSLLPFFVLSIILSASLTGTDIFILRPIGRLCRMPRGSESLLLMGLLGGYPAGAQGVAQAYHAGQLNKETASRLLGFCSNAGPAFLFGIASVVFDEGWFPWVLWLIHILSALVAGVLLPGGAHQDVRLPEAKSVSVTDAIERSVKIMARVCAWIILFRILQSFIQRWLLSGLLPYMQVGVIGFLELANGCLQLVSVTDAGLRAVLCSAFLAFGGVCVMMQTASVTGTLGLGMYIAGKALQCTVSVLLTLIMQYFCLPDSVLSPHSPLLIAVFAAFLTIFTLVLRKYEKKSSIPAAVGV